MGGRERGEKKLVLQRIMKNLGREKGSEALLPLQQEINFLFSG